MTQSMLNREYRVAPELRRSCWYVIFAVPVLGGVFGWVAWVVQNRGPVDIAGGCVLFVLVAVAMVLWPNDK